MLHCMLRVLHLHVDEGLREVAREAVWSCRADLYCLVALLQVDLEARHPGLDLPVHLPWEAVSR